MVLAPAAASHLIVSQSQYKPGPAPQSQVRVYETHPFGRKATVYVEVYEKEEQP
jgi:hypothetical protein